MSSNGKSTEEEQDEAFFGDVKPRSSPFSSQDNDAITNIHLRGNIQKERDREYAQRLQNERQATEDTTVAVETTGSTVATGLHYGDLLDERRRQEEEDAKLAKALQEAEEAYHDESNKRGLTAICTNRDKNRDRNRASGIRDHHTINALIPRCATCNEIVAFPLYAMGNLYHKECFRCMACHDLIEPNENFAVTTGPDGKTVPLHKNCYGELYGLKCTVCRNTIQGDSNGRVSYIKHPFFEEIMCPSHNVNTGRSASAAKSTAATPHQRKCTGCHRFEPLPVGSNTGFADLGDADRCICYSCCRTVIVDSHDAKSLWGRIIRFFEEGLKLPIFRGMSDIPILIVPHDALNAQLQHSNHQGSSQIMTRGLCLSEHQIGSNFFLSRLRFDKNAGSFLPSDDESRGHTYFRIPDASKTNPQTNVTAILCLTGLPSDLCASILAHEATHAWIKLHPGFNPTRPIPPQVEEGCCQLVAMLFLNDGLDEPATNNNDGDGPSDEKLRQYFKFSIETDTNEVYGEGYRKAARAYAQIGIEELLSHVVNYREFPNI